VEQAPDFSGSEIAVSWPGRGAGLFGGELYDRIERRVHFGDAGEAGLGRFERGKSSRSNCRSDGGG
jgi:hypothetical protein